MLLVLFGVIIYDPLLSQLRMCILSYSILLFVDFLKIRVELRLFAYDHTTMNTPVLV